MPRQKNIGLARLHASNTPGGGETSRRGRPYGCLRFLRVALRVQSSESAMFMRVLTGLRAAGHVRAYSPVSRAKGCEAAVVSEPVAKTWDRTKPLGSAPFASVWIGAKRGAQLISQARTPLTPGSP